MESLSFRAVPKQANEFVCASMGANDLVQPNSAFIHAIGLKPGDYVKMALDGTSIVWSPRSNVSLYGDTAQVAVCDVYKPRIERGQADCGPGTKGYSDFRKLLEDKDAPPEFDRVCPD